MIHLLVHFQFPKSLRNQVHVLLILLPYFFSTIFKIPLIPLTFSLHFTKNSCSNFSQYTYLSLYLLSHNFNIHDRSSIPTFLLLSTKGKATNLYTYFTENITHLLALLLSSLHYCFLFPCTNYFSLVSPHILVLSHLFIYY